MHCPNLHKPSIQEPEPRPAQIEAFSAAISKHELETRDYIVIEAAINSTDTAIRKEVAFVLDCHLRQESPINMGALRHIITTAKYLSTLLQLGQYAQPEELDSRLDLLLKKNPHTLEYALARLLGNEVLKRHPATQIKIAEMRLELCSRISFSPEERQSLKRYAQKGLTGLIDRSGIDPEYQEQAKILFHLNFSIPKLCREPDITKILEAAIFFHSLARRNNPYGQMGLATMLLAFPTEIALAGQDKRELAYHNYKLAAPRLPKARVLLAKNFPDKLGPEGVIDEYREAASLCCRPAIIALAKLFCTSTDTAQRTEAILYLSILRTFFNEDYFFGSALPLFLDEFGIGPGVDDRIRKIANDWAMQHDILAVDDHLERQILIRPGDVF